MGRDAIHAQASGRPWDRDFPGGSAYQALAALLRGRADELGLSVRALAARLGRPHTTVHKMLRGQRRLDPIEFVDWCEALELDDSLAVIASARRG